MAKRVGSVQFRRVSTFCLTSYEECDLLESKTFRLKGDFELPFILHSRFRAIATVWKFR